MPSNLENQLREQLHNAMRPLSPENQKKMDEAEEKISSALQEASERVNMLDTINNFIKEEGLEIPGKDYKGKGEFPSVWYEGNDVLKKMVNGKKSWSAIKYDDLNKAYNAVQARQYAKDVEKQKREALSAAYEYAPIKSETTFTPEGRANEMSGALPPEKQGNLENMAREMKMLEMAQLNSNNPFYHGYLKETGDKDEAIERLLRQHNLVQPPSFLDKFFRETTDKTVSGRGWESLYK